MYFSSLPPFPLLVSRNISISSRLRSSRLRAAFPDGFCSTFFPVSRYCRKNVPSRISRGKKMSREKRRISDGGGGYEKYLNEIPLALGCMAWQSDTPPTSNRIIRRLTEPSSHPCRLRARDQARLGSPDHSTGGKKNSTRKGGQTNARAFFCYLFIRRHYFTHHSRVVIIIGSMGVVYVIGWEYFKIRGLRKLKTIRASLEDRISNRKIRWQNFGPRLKTNCHPNSSFKSRLQIWRISTLDIYILNRSKIHSGYILESETPRWHTCINKRSLFLFSRIS